MPQITFPVDKAGRWLDRIGKRLATLTPEDASTYKALRAVHDSGQRLDARQTKLLSVLGKKI